MIKKNALILILLFLPLFAYAAKPTNDSSEFSCAEYALTPPFLVDAAAPSTSIIIDTSGSMNEHAYQENSATWKDSTISSTNNFKASTGYNSSEEYYGFFDSSEFYAYNASGPYFYNSTKSTQTWSGNFLNWVSMHRIDILKKALTGGAYNNSTSTYTVSISDGAGQRGQYHLFDADLDSNATQFSGKLLLCQNSTSAANLSVYRATSVNSTNNEWAVDTSTQLGNFTLSVWSEKKYGIIDRFGRRSRLALFKFDDDGDYHNGAKVLQHMTSDPSAINDAINAINLSTFQSWSPLAEALHTVCGYIMQDTQSGENGPQYETDSYTVSTTTDPFYFEDLNNTVDCTKQNIIFITDGESTKDEDINPLLTTITSDVAENDNATYTDDGTGYLDNVAYWAHTTDLRTDLEGNQTINIFTISTFGNDSQLLQDAAKWGGFTDIDGDLLPDSNEYDGNQDGVADNYFLATNGAEIEGALISAFSNIFSRVSSGSAASVVSTSRKGEGLLYQAVFWPQLDAEDSSKIYWAGDVYAYWLDKEGIMYENDGTDSNSYTLELDPNDSKVTVWYDAPVKRSRACSGGEVINGICVGVNSTVKELQEVTHVWAASDWLNGISNSTILDQRSPYNATSVDKRFIKTWYDDGDGEVENGEYVDFNATDAHSDFFNSTDISWLRGRDIAGYRSRERVNSNSTNVTWRLGDVINSSPTVVAAPAENYDLIWEDATYGDFYKKYKNRRIMVYFGANDGMLHAVNSGFYNSITGDYCKSIGTDGNCSATGGFELGTEMWAYIPYNLHPHLKCLTSTNYQHQYYVDLKPRIFDAKIFDDNVDGDHPGGWGTILVCGFNFGGDERQDLEYPSESENYFGSSFFIFDVTNPEKEPVFLGEFTFDNDYTAGYAINQPTIVAIKDPITTNIVWYMLFGTGPQTPDGQSTQKAQVIVVPLKKLVTHDGSKYYANPDFSLRLDDDKTKPTKESMGVLSLSDSNSAMGTGFVSIDYNFDFFVDMMYYGTVVTPNNGRLTGGVHRLKVEAEPDPSKWERKEMTNTGGPMTGAPNVGFKGEDAWVYFGTGKFWVVSDKDDQRTQYMYGIMEPKFTNSNAYNFSQIPAGNLIDVTNFYVRNDGVGTLNCGTSTNSTDCLPSDVVTVEDLAAYIRNTPSVDGWKRAMLNPGERVIGQPTLFGGLCNFTSFTPSADICAAEGTSKLYALYYLTGTAWKESVFGDYTGDFVPFEVDLGQGMGVSPSLHLGSEEGVRAFVQTSTGSIIEIHQPNLPIPNVKSGRGGWHTFDVDF